MNQHEIDAIREVIEELITEIGINNVPEDVDVEGALQILVDQEMNKVEACDASKEEGADAPVEEATPVVL